VKTLKNSINFVRKNLVANLSGDELTKLPARCPENKKELFVNYDGKITINPKIDSKVKEESSALFLLKY
jgi:hypothetical protein